MLKTPFQLDEKLLDTPHRHYSKLNQKKTFVKFSDELKNLKQKINQKSIVKIKFT